MRILGLETSTHFGSVALIDDTRLIAEYRISLKMKHAERLLPLIDILLKESKVSLSDLNAIAVSIGPGSFTGLRVGLSTAKGLAIGRGLPLFPIPTLEAMVVPFCHANAVVVALITARKGEVYWAIFSPEGVRLYPDSVGLVENVLQIITQEKVLFVGDGAILHHDKIVTDFQGMALFPSIGMQFPFASSVAQMGRARLMNREAPSAEDGYDPCAVVPVYLHEVSHSQMSGKSA